MAHLHHLLLSPSLLLLQRLHSCWHHHLQVHH
jgi:hypothetical protein